MTQTKSEIRESMSYMLSTLDWMSVMAEDLKWRIEDTDMEDKETMMTDVRVISCAIDRLIQSMTDMPDKDSPVTEEEAAAGLSALFG